MVETKIVARPWQPQDLIDDLQGIIDEECDNYLNTRRTTLCMARDYLKEHFAEQKWIPVTERLPEEPLQTILVTNGKQVCVGVYSVVYEEFGVMCGKGRGQNKRFGVTHWMPLPDPPKEE